ncbi:TetR/AcrR family transcriptional regulator [Nocardia salmonicida]|uniref:TetR/AcrR family transcriptional regulator n=1 Tax=Nocardia salmonicida TaxID=53431 RepID=A0ABZ1NER1_9NOCA
MSAASNPTGSSSVTPRGRIDKQQAVLAAAFIVFARAGYAQARVDEIAAVAQVAKATVYNHFGDKENLFRQVVQSLTNTALAANLAAVEQLVGDGTDLPENLREVGLQLATCYCLEESRALRRLVAAESAHFPDLIDIVAEVPHRVVQTLADRLSRLALAGVLRIDDPELAATHFTALLTGSIDTRSKLGTHPLATPELRIISDAATTTFLKAFGASAIHSAP